MSPPFPRPQTQPTSRLAPPRCKIDRHEHGTQGHRHGDPPCRRRRSGRGSSSSGSRRSSSRGSRLGPTRRARRRPRTSSRGSSASRGSSRPHSSRARALLPELNQLGKELPERSSVRAGITIPRKALCCHGALRGVRRLDAPNRRSRLEHERLEPVGGNAQTTGVVEPSLGRSPSPLHSPYQDRRNTPRRVPALWVKVAHREAQAFCRLKSATRSVHHDRWGLQGVLGGKLQDAMIQAASVRTVGRPLNDVVKDEDVRFQRLCLRGQVGAERRYRIQLPGSPTHPNVLWRLFL